MAISDSSKVDLMWKKLQFGTTKSDTSAAKSGSNETISSPLPVYANNIWAQAGSIPATPPTSATGVVALLTGANRIAAVEDTTSTLNATWKTGVTNWIPASFGANYAVKVYVGDPQTTGVQIFPDTSGTEYTFDYQAGVLNFPGGLPANIANGIYVAGYQYIGTLGLTGAGAGVKSAVVADITARNAITGSATGDIVFVQDASGIPTDAAPGQYAVYMWTGSAWTVIATQDSGAADDKVVTVAIDHTATGTIAVNTARAKASVVSVQVNVTSAFDGTMALSVGTTANNTQLIDVTESDLQTAGTYVLNMNTMLSNSVDTPVNIYITGTATVGAATITVTYA
jgi:hypothetical protein